MKKNKSNFTVFNTGKQWVPIPEKSTPEIPIPDVFMVRGNQTVLGAGANIVSVDVPPFQANVDMRIKRIKVLPTFTPIATLIPTLNLNYSFRIPVLGIQNNIAGVTGGNVAQQFIRLAGNGVNNNCYDVDYLLKVNNQLSFNFTIYQPGVAGDTYDVDVVIETEV